MRWFSLPLTTCVHRVEVDDKLKPVVELAFDAIEEGAKFYNEYML